MPLSLLSSAPFAAVQQTDDHHFLNVAVTTAPHTPRVCAISSGCVWVLSELWALPRAIRNKVSKNSNKTNKAQTMVKHSGLLLGYDCTVMRCVNYCIMFVNSLFLIMSVVTYIPMFWFDHLTSNNMYSRQPPEGAVVVSWALLNWFSTKSELIKLVFSSHRRECFLN